VRAFGIPEKDVAALFSNADQLLQVNKEFLSQLKKRREETPIVEKIGDIILSMVKLTYFLSAFI